MTSVVDGNSILHATLAFEIKHGQTHHLPPDARHLRSRLVGLKYALGARPD